MKKMKKMKAGMTVCLLMITALLVPASLSNTIVVKNEVETVMESEVMGEVKLCVGNINTAEDVWVKTDEGHGMDLCHSVQQTTDGGYIIAGYTGSYWLPRAILLNKADRGGKPIAYLLALDITNMSINGVIKLHVKV